jgi:aromatic ring-opening dioxygenase LigB subunit
MPKIHTILVPHNPLIISKIGGKNSNKLKTTMDAMKKIREKIYTINPAKIFLICPSYNDLDNITINQSEKYIVNLKEFGDLKIEFEVKGDFDYSTRLKYLLRKNDFNFNIVSNELADYHSFVPLYYLNKLHTSSKGFKNELNYDPNLKSEFIIVHAGCKNFDYHIKFGELLHQFIRETKEKILIIICADFAKRDKKADKESLENTGKLSYRIIDMMKEKKYNEILSFEELKNNIYPWVKPFLMTLQILAVSKQKPSIMALDKEFGEIYLSIDFN